MQTNSTHSETTVRRPRVTVLMPAYNAERYIAEAIESVLAQTFTDFELLVIDDGSTDATADVIRRFAYDERMRVVERANNIGQPETRNQGLDLARGEYIAFLDADDCCAPQRLEKQITFLDIHADVDGVGSWMNWIDENGDSMSLGVRECPVGSDQITCTMLFESPLVQGSMMLRSKAFRGYRYNSAFRVAEDYDIWARMSATCRFSNFPETLTSYRRHDTQSISINSEHAKIAGERAIHSQQIVRLGLKPTELDLARHERLFKFSSRQSVLERTGAPLDIEYLRWARNWLAKLRDGNAAHGVYPEPTFSHMLAARWLFAARKTLRSSGFLPVARELARSRLTGLAVAHPLQQFKNRRRKSAKRLDNR